MTLTRKILLPDYRALMVLAAAWLCANLPVTTATHFAGWLHGAAHFSHQAALRAEVAHLLAQPLRPAMATADARPAPPAPALPPGLWLKRTEWVAVEAFHLPPPPVTTSAGTEAGPPPPVGPTADVPHPPPRGSADA